LHCIVGLYALILILTFHSNVGDDYNIHHVSHDISQLTKASSAESMGHHGTWFAVIDNVEASFRLYRCHSLISPVVLSYSGLVPSNK